MQSNDTIIGDALVGFSGPGGASSGLRRAGFQTRGIELDRDACATATTMGLDTLQADITTLDPHAWFATHIGVRDPSRPFLVQQSPPCPGFSKAGSGLGRLDLPLIRDAVHDLAMIAQDDADEAVALWCKLLATECRDQRSALTFEPIRWVAALDPDYVMLEQVPEVLVVWEVFATVLRAWGYSVWTGKVYAEQYGVPQTRIRAILMASKHGEVHPPVPTHSRFHNRSPARLDEGVAKWVSMAEALGWGGTDKVGFPRRYDGQGEPLVIGDVEYRGRDFRDGAEPAFSITEKIRSWTRYEVEHGIVEGAPRLNNQSGTDFDYSWPADRPAPVIAGRGLVTMPGANANRFNGATKSRNDGIRVTVQEAAVLQSFPPDWSFQGTKTSQYGQVGNAVPPLLQYVLTTQLIEENR